VELNANLLSRLLARGVWAGLATLASCGSQKTSENVRASDATDDGAKTGAVHAEDVEDSLDAQPATGDDAEQTAAAAEGDQSQQDGEGSDASGSNSNEPSASGDGSSDAQPGADQPSVAVVTPEGVVDDEQAGEQSICPDEMARGCSSPQTPLALGGLTMVILYDVSSSWGSETQPYWRRDLKWEPMLAATKAFFTDPKSVGMSATLTFYPNELAATVGDGIASPVAVTDAGPVEGGGFGPSVPAEVCNAAGYVDPDVELTALPSEAFGTAIDAITPETEEAWRLSSPLAGALEGGFELATALQDERPDDQVIVLMITDGYPALCGGMDGDIEPVVQVIDEAQGAPLYVIGVRDPVTQEEPNPPDAATLLHELTRASGTGDAHLVDTGDPAATEEAIAGALREITRKRSCVASIPPPPVGEPFDPERINLSLGSGDQTTPLVYDPTCTDGLAWYYDDEAEPTAFEFCDEACAGATQVGATMGLGCYVRTAASPD
jgi:hypothetical protein